LAGDEELPPVNGLVVCREEDLSQQPTCADGAPLWVKMVALRAGLAEPLDGDRVEAGKSAVACDPDQQSGPRCAEVPFFVAPGTREHAWQCLERTCGATIARSDAEASMRVMIERVAGLDVHQETVVACVLIGKPGERPTKEVRTFRTMTRDLEALREWLLSLGVTHVGMESTGIYWKPVYAVLEGSFELIVGNARHIRNVPGRKTDVKDAEWIADLVRHGLIAKSFVPPPPLRELRDLLRYRRKLVESQAAERNRLLKLLETANIKLASVVSDVFGVSGRAMLKALIEGTASAQAMADLAKGQLRRKRADLVLALEGRVEEHHRFLLGLQLRRLEAAEEEIAALDARIDEKLEPYRAPHALLMQIPGVDRLVAAVLIAEIGIDMSVFLSVYHLASWAGVCPGNHESAGKQKSGRARNGNVHLRTMLVGAAISASRAKGSYLKDKFYRLKARRGSMRAALAIAHKILVAAYHMLAKGVGYREIGEAYLDQISQTRTVANLKRRLERLGFQVTLQSKAQSAA
jgi:transposase